MVRLNNEPEIEPKIGPRSLNEFDNDLILNDAPLPPETMENKEVEESRENQEKDELFREFISDMFSDSEDAPVASGNQVDEAVQLTLRPKDQPWEFYKVCPGSGAGGYGRANRDWEAEERAEDLRVEQEQERVRQQEVEEREERVKLQKQAEEKARLLKEQEKQKEKPSLYQQVVDQRLQGREIPITGTDIEAGVGGTINQVVASDAQQNQDLQINDGSQPSRPSLRERRLQRPTGPQPLRRVDVGSNFIVHEPQKAGFPDKINPYPNGREIPMSIRVPEQQNRPNNLSPSRVSLPKSPVLPIPSPTERRFNALDPVDAQAFLGLGIKSPSGTNDLYGVKSPIRLEGPLQTLRPDVVGSFAPANFNGGKGPNHENGLSLTKLTALCQGNEKILDLRDDRAEEARNNIRRYNTLKTVLSTLRTRGANGRLAVKLNPNFVQEMQKQWNHKDRIIFRNLAVNQIKLAGTEIEMPLFPSKIPRGAPTRVETMDSRGCSFCLYECGWGVADLRILLSYEHATGSCESCAKAIISVQGNARDVNSRSAVAKQPNDERAVATEERSGQPKDWTGERPAFGSKSMDARNAGQGSVDNPSSANFDILRQNGFNESSQRTDRNPLQEIGALAGRSLGTSSAGQPSQYPQQPHHGQTGESGDQGRMQGQFHQQPQDQGVHQFPVRNAEKFHSAVELGPDHSPQGLARYEYSSSNPDEQHMTLRGGAGEQLDHQSSPLMYNFTGGFVETPAAAFGIGPDHSPQELARYEFSLPSPDVQHLSLRGGAGDMLPQESDEDNDEPSLPPKMTQNGSKPPLPKKSASRPPKQKITKNSGTSSQSGTTTPGIQKKNGNSATKPTEAKKSGSRQPKLTRNGGKPPLNSPAPASDLQPDRISDEEDDGAILYQVKRSYGQNGKSETATPTGPRKPAAATRRKTKATATIGTNDVQVQDGEEEEDEAVEDTMVGNSAGKQLSGLRESNSSITESHASNSSSQKKVREQASTPANPSTKKRGAQGTLSSEPPHKKRNPDRKPDDRRIGPSKKEVELGLDQASEAPERYVPYFDIHSGLDKDQKKSFLEDGRRAANERQLPAPRTLDDVIAQGLIPIPALIPRRLKHNRDEEAAYRAFWGWRYEHQQIAKRNGKSFESLLQDGTDYMVEPAGHDVPNPPPKGNDPGGYALARSARDIAMAGPIIPSSAVRPRKNQASSSRGTLTDSGPSRSSSPQVRESVDTPNQPTSSPLEHMVSGAVSPSAPRGSGHVNFSNGFNGSSPMQGYENQMGSSPPGNMAGFLEAQGNTGFGADHGRGLGNSYAQMSASPYDIGRSSPQQNPSGGFQQAMSGARSASRPQVGSKVPSMQSTPQPLTRTPPTHSSSGSFNNFQNSGAQMSAQPRPRFTPLNAPKNPSGLRYSQIASPLLPPRQPHFTHLFVGPPNHGHQQHFQPNRFLLPPQLPPFPSIPHYMHRQQYDEFLQPRPPPQPGQNLENQENIPPAPPSSPPPQFGTAPSQDGNPNRDGILLCASSPYGQIDVTKARICEHCRAKKLEIVHHRHYNFIELSRLGGEMSGYVHAGLEEGRRMRACMICPAHAYWRCQGCPLRVCESCKVLLVNQCKGLVENLLKWHFRGHVRNDAFLLRSDGGGY